MWAQKKTGLAEADFCFLCRKPDRLLAFEAVAEQQLWHEMDIINQVFGLSCRPITKNHEFHRVHQAACTLMRGQCGERLVVDGGCRRRNEHAVGLGAVRTQILVPAQQAGISRNSAKARGQTVAALCAQVDAGFRFGLGAAIGIRVSHPHGTSGKIASAGFVLNHVTAFLRGVTGEVDIEAAVFHQIAYRTACRGGKGRKRERQPEDGSDG